MAISKLTATWTGFAGSPGYTNFYFDLFAGVNQANAAATAARTMLNGLPGYLPNNLSIKFTGVWQDYDDVSGTLQGTGAYTAPTAVTGTNTTAYSGLSGAVIRWITPAVIGGRVVSGRTFLVPLVGCYDTDGTLAPAFVTAISALANTFATYVGIGVSGHPVVWHRPVNGSGGSSNDMSGATVPDKAVVLRSRRG